MEGLTTKGSTPFEKAAQRRAQAHLMIVTHIAVKEIVEQIEECDRAIAIWNDTITKYNAGTVTKDELNMQLDVASQALKDRKVFEAALVQIAASAGADLGLEA